MPESPTGQLTINHRLRIPVSEFRFTYSRSQGPGGQNVNKVNSKVLLRWPIQDSDSLPHDVKQRFLAKHGNRVTQQGDLLISSQRYRDQGRNVDDCLNKLRQLILDVAVAPQVRRKTKPTKGSQRRRRKEKTNQSEKKARRRPPRHDD